VYTTTPLAELSELAGPPLWPEGAPPRPIPIEALYNPGVYVDKVQRWIAEAAAACLEKHADCIIGPEEQPEWARGCVWDTRDPHDCVPIASFSKLDPPQQGVRASFFERWQGVMPGADLDMHHQVRVRGISSRSACPRVTVLTGHHGGVRKHEAVVRQAVHDDTERGWITSGAMHPLTVPVRLSPKNVATQLKWKLVRGVLTQVAKYRVTTNDSYEAEGVGSRNGCMPVEDWPVCELPTFRDLGEAVAILKAARAAVRSEVPLTAINRIAMWAMDLSNAFRELAVARQEWWLQQFLWHDGVRLDYRCLFGSANLVGIFERISTSVMAVAKYKVAAYDRDQPHRAERRAWARDRHARGLRPDASWAGIYIDDGFGATPLAEDEPLRGGDAAAPVTTCLVVTPGGEVELETFVDASRAQAHLAISARTFQDAGWVVAEPKTQLGFEIEVLGIGITSDGQGAFHVPELKRAGLGQDLRSQQRSTASRVPVSHDDVETLVGRLSHIAQVVCEGKAYLAPMYNAKCMRLRSRGVSYIPRRLELGGEAPGPTAYRGCLDWWHEVLRCATTVPLAPKRHFPELGKAGVAFFFTDAAREAATGFGGWTVVRSGSVARLYYCEQRWEPDTLGRLQRDEFSMPAGECFGAVVMAAALLDLLPGITHLVCFTDSDATAKAFSAAASGAPQLNVMIQWLLERHARVQHLGVHVRGADNHLADALSRYGEAEALRLAGLAGMQARRVQPAAEAASLLQRAQSMPLRQCPSPAAQDHGATPS
jgi:hypothetical protein